VIAVTRLGRSTRDGAERMREQLVRLEAPMLGIVANGIKARRGGKYGYGYYGGYYGPPEERQGATEQGAGAAAGSSSGKGQELGKRARQPRSRRLLPGPRPGRLMADQADVAEQLLDLLEAAEQHLAAGPGADVSDDPAHEADSVEGSGARGKSCL
jgi:hypothetical protein